MADPQVTAPATAPTSSADSASDARPDVSSPALSVKTVIPIADGPARMPILDPDRLVIASSGLAIFSTDLGRRPPRDPPGPPFPPVIVRSAKVEGVVAEAHYWWKQYPRQYHCFFPGCGYTVHDLFDKAYLHENSPSFAEEVLKFITQENAFLANRFAIKWSKENPNSVLTLSKDLLATGLYEPSNPLAIVDKIFVHGEIDTHPRQFLWHTLNIMRLSMQSVDQAENKNALVQPVSTKETVKQYLIEDGQSNIDTISAKWRKNKSVDEGRHPRQRKFSGTGSYALPTMTPSAAAFGGMPYSFAHSASSVPQAPYATPLVPLHSFVVEGHQPGSPLGSHPAFIPPSRVHSQAANSLRIRPSRQGSGSFHHSMPQGRMENMQMHRTGPPTRQSSGTITALQSPRFYHPQLSVGQPMLHTNNVAGQFPPGSTIPAAFVDVIQSPFAPPMYSAMPPSKVGPYRPMETGEQNFPAASSSGQQLGPLMGPPGPRFLMGDLTNHLSGSFDDPPTRGGLNQHGARPDRQQVLYDPKRSDFVPIPTHQPGRKRHESVSNQSGRPRKFSSNSYNRSAHGRYNSDRGEYGPSFPSAEPPEARHGTSSSFAHSGILDPKITGDLERGCDESFIGPKNDYVFRLKIFELPRDVSDSEIRYIFEQAIGTAVDKVHLLTDKNNNIHATVTFLSVADARKGLQVNQHILRGKTFAVKVLRSYYQNDHPMTRGYYEGGVPTRRASMHGVSDNCRTSFTRPKPNLNDTSDPTSELTYSPQDARSDLQRQRDQEKIPFTGSPEKQKPKKQKKAKAKASNGDLTGERGNESKMNETAENKLQEQSAMLGNGRKVNIGPNCASPAMEIMGVESADLPAIEVKTKEQPELSNEETTTCVESVMYTKHEETESLPIASGTPKTDVQIAKLDETCITPPLEGMTSEHNVAADDSLKIDAPPLQRARPTPSLLAATSIEREIEIPIAQSTELAQSSSDMGTVKNATDKKIKLSTVGSEVSTTVGSGREQHNDGVPQAAAELQSEAVASIFDDREPSQQHSPLPASKSTPISNNDEGHHLEMNEHKNEQPAVETVDSPINRTATEPLRASKKPGNETTAPTKALGGVEKKPGPKQTESLSVFAKSKAQQKKEKEAKKKDKKKKAQGVKFDQDANLIKGPEKILGLETPPKVSNGQLESEDESATTAEKSKHSDELSTKLSGRDHDLSLFNAAPMDVESARVKSHSSVELSKQELPNMSTASGSAQSYSAVAKSSCASNGSAISTQVDVIPTSNLQGQAKNATIAGQKVAMPNLGNLLRPAKPRLQNSTSVSPEPMVSSQRDCVLPALEGESFSALVSNRNPVEKHTISDELAEGTNGNGQIQHDAESLKSPTAADFYTPLQTPTALNMPQVAPQKKSKSKKKKNKKSHIVAEEISKASEADGAAFGEQLSHVDGLMKGKEILHPPTSYYATRDRQMDNESNETCNGSEKEASKVSLALEVLTYLHGKEAKARRSQGYIENDENYKPPENVLIRGDLEQILNGPNYMSPVAKRFHDDGGKCPKAGSMSFFGHEKGRKEAEGVNGPDT